MSLIRKNILNITPYQPGKPIDEVRREYGLKDIIKLASNENPFGASPAAVKRLKKEIFAVNRYPDGSCYYLKNALAGKYGLKPANFCCGNGSDELIDVIIRTFVEDDEEVLTADNTFLEYGIISRINNRRFTQVPLTYFRYNLEAIRRRVNKKTKVIFIANPNNPTGTYVTKYEVEELFKNLPPDVIVVFDEAYDLFVDVDDFPRSLSYLERKNVIVLKTCSKSYGLAGLRLGYAIARPEFIAYMERVRPPFNVNILAQAAGVAALKDDKFLNQVREKTLVGKRYLYEQLDKMGVPYIPSVANFILVDTGKDCVTVFKGMLKRGVIVRDMKQYGLKNFIRVSVGTSKENQRFIKIFKEVL
ncbi:MAG: histidinol-phosphate transaminase [Candidatus Omnitrophica bacterium]|jgi:histidinol-phosphate aminotransferase|nr:histidinol-phosphate transaminase [Candidatus Omnitrophota bacterium]MDD5655191.1 histidinol-phosphate transaminase [Candidatus Omnitrophota bacterium]